MMIFSFKINKKSEKKSLKPTKEKIRQCFIIVIMTIRESFECMLSPNCVVLVQTGGKLSEAFRGAALREMKAIQIEIASL